MGKFSIYLAPLFRRVRIVKGKYARQIRQQAQRLGEQVVFLGKLDQQELLSFYHQLNVLVLPSINSTEAFGLVQVEAMLAGVPVVATDLPGVRVPLQRTGMGKIVPPRDPQALAEALVQLFNKREQYRQLTAKAKQEFAYNKTIKFYQRLFLST